MPLFTINNLGITRKTRVIWLGLPVLFFCLCLVVSSFMFGPLKEDKRLHIPKGSGLSAIAFLLEKEDVVYSRYIFRTLAHITGFSRSLDAGHYLFTAQESAASVLFKLAQGQTEKLKITFPEGLRTSEIMDILQKNKGIEWDVSLKDIQNETVFLLPETYVLDHGTKASFVLKKMKEAGRFALEEAWNSRTSGLPLSSKEELLTLASIVEKETSLDAERTEVAGVFVNRLNRNMRLQSDPTVIYGLKNYDGDIRHKDLKDPHPYNTYRHNGLPPGPIAYPGKASLMAVANPKRTTNLYFVANGLGGHVFAPTLKEHNKNVQAYLKYYREQILKRK